MNWIVVSFTHMFKIFELYPTHKPNALPESYYLNPELRNVLSADRYKFRKFRDTNKNDFSDLIFLFRKR